MLLRPLLFLACTAILLLPDWSTARPFRRWLSAAPVPCPPAFSYSPPVVYHAAPVYPAPVYLPPVQACPPASPAPRGPQVIPERMAEPKSTTKAEETKPAPAAPTAPTAIRTIGNEERLPPMPVPLQPTTDRQPTAARPTTDLATPKAATEESHRPAVKPDPLPAFPDLGKPADPKADRLPAFPDLSKPTDPKADRLPAFDDLPPLPPLAPPLPAASELPAKTTVKSSPLNADGVAGVYPLAGPRPAVQTSKRSVGFVNKSERDLLLTVGGKTTTLPSGHYLRLDLPPTFIWQIGGEKEREITVPTDAPGVDVVIRK